MLCSDLWWRGQLSVSQQSLVHLNHVITKHVHAHTHTHTHTRTTSWLRYRRQHCVHQRCYSDYYFNWFIDGGLLLRCITKVLSERKQLRNAQWHWRWQWHRQRRSMSTWGMTRSLRSYTVVIIHCNILIKCCFLRDTSMKRECEFWNFFQLWSSVIFEFHMLKETRITV